MSGAKPKILFLTNRSPYPVRDGQTRRTYNILRGLAAANEVYLLSLCEDPQEQDPENIRHLESFCKSVELYQAPSKKLSAGMIVRLLRSMVSLEPYTVWRHYSSPYLKAIRRITQRFPFDLIHCDILCLAYALPFIKDFTCVLTDHDVSYLKALRMTRERRNPLVRWLLYLDVLKLKRLESRVFGEVDLGIAVSESDKAHLKTICPDGKFEVVENGVDTSEFKPAQEQPEPSTLVWVGGFNHVSNREAMHYFLDKIYPGIKSEVKDVRLNIIGAAMTEKLKRHAAEDPSIKLLGFVQNPVPVIQKAAVFIAPLLSGGGTKLKVLEALAVGKAVVSTGIGVEGIEGQDRRHFLVADDPDEFAKKVIEVLKDRPLRNYLGVNARKLAEEKYDWKSIVQKTDHIYRGLIAERDRRHRYGKTGS
jgi:glycosyltransferase involved in cell wall biosynthesis